MNKNNVNNFLGDNCILYIALIAAYPALIAAYPALMVIPKSKSTKIYMSRKCLTDDGM